MVLLDEIAEAPAPLMGITSLVYNRILTPSSLFPKLYLPHYHELNELANTHERIENYNVSVKEVGQKIIFLRKLIGR